MPAIDYNAIMSPHGAAQGFAELASTIARIPQIRREQALKKIQFDMEQRRLDQNQQAMQGMLGYRQALSSAAGQRADAYGRSVDIHGQAVDNQNENRTFRTGEQVNRWHDQDRVEQQRADEAGRTNDLRETGLTLQAGRMIPTDTYTPDTDAFGHTHSVRSSLPITPSQRISQGQDLMLQARPASRYGAALGGPPPAAPPMQAPAPMQGAPQAAAPAPAGDQLDAVMTQAHPQDQAMYQRIKALPEGPDKERRLAVVRQTFLGAGDAAPAAPAP